MRAGDRAYQTLREEITNGDLPAGTVLGEVEQAVRLGISRTPVREALRQLISEGLAVQRPRGVEVSEVSFENISELYDVRLALECQAARLAARNRDADVFRTLLVDFQHVSDLLNTRDRNRHDYYELVNRLDDALDQAVRNPYLVSAMATVRTHLARIRHMARSDRARLMDAAREHALIVQAIIDGDGDLAAHATHVHLYNSLSHRLAKAASLETHSADAVSPDEGDARETA
ncbi:GntR family transcriptional regulator [Pseudoclavibacter sp. CFCC 11306]|uniref:GntR family transcriptional regulator n=1 Tax=Pseudoclavibacter sp. CFCC 11306 TaxID=1564493 RepID=UPI00130197BC|nr:GntR family transcriptional regulator [Pseudoclavibacter sp. CFCC 11306]KAB1657586.1 GntR family transcriptional regulator [Pseudoclavibacter sp. CFCC 11306]